MSSFTRADDKLHYEDNSHRWISANPDDDPAAFRAKVAAHMQRHKENPEPNARPAAPPPPIGW